eukprot:m.26567 g.26567  ORF g.26567 m.26567 type:complete len:420 (+) comp7809_c0_seq1:101-1360(+)
MSFFMDEIEDIASMRVADLREALRARNLPATGRKADLQARLQESIQEESQARENEGVDTYDIETQPMEPSPKKKPNKKPTRKQLYDMKKKKEKEQEKDGASQTTSVSPKVETQQGIDFTSPAASSKGNGTQDSNYVSMESTSGTPCSENKETSSKKRAGSSLGIYSQDISGESQLSAVGSGKRRKIDQEASTITESNIKPTVTWTSSLILKDPEGRICTVEAKKEKLNDNETTKIQFFSGTFIYEASDDDATKILPALSKLSVRSFDEYSLEVSWSVVDAHAEALSIPVAKEIDKREYCSGLLERLLSKLNGQQVISGGLEAKKKLEEKEYLRAVDEAMVPNAMGPDLTTREKHLLLYDKLLQSKKDRICYLREKAPKEALENIKNSNRNNGSASQVDQKKSLDLNDSIGNIDVDDLDF